MLPNVRATGPFKETDERREYETLSHNKRQSVESMTKLQRGLHSVHKCNDNVMNLQMKKLLQAQTKINSRIEDLRQKQENELTRWSSLPRIDESETWCADPYPITFQSVRPIKLSDGGKKYPMRQRRKSIEFEDIPLLAYNSTSPAGLLPSPPKQDKLSVPGSPATASPRLTRRVLHRSPLAQRKKIKDELKENILLTNSAENLNQNRENQNQDVENLHQDTENFSLDRENPHQDGENFSQHSIRKDKPLTVRFTASARLPSLDTKELRDSKPTTPPIVTKFSNIDKEMVVNSPLGKRKLNTLLSNKSSTTVES